MRRVAAGWEAICLAIANQFFHCKNIRLILVIQSKSFQRNIVLVSPALRRPFTLQYAREQVPSDLWGSPEFVRTNYVITAAWAVAFAVMVLADVTLTYLPALPRSISIVATVLALVAAVKFTGWYPTRQRNIVPGR